MLTVGFISLLVSTFREAEGPLDTLAAAEAAEAADCLATLSDLFTRCMEIEDELCISPGAVVARALSAAIERNEDDACMPDT